MSEQEKGLTFWNMFLLVLGICVVAMAPAIVVDWLY